MFGISVYFQDLDADYIRYAAKKGAKIIFTSLHIPEEDLTNVYSQMQKLLALASELKIEVVADISPLTFEKLKLQKDDFKGLKALGIKIVRLDFGFDDLEIVKTVS